jgi:hypothetical protein
MDSEEMSLNAVFRLNKTYYKNGVKIAVEKVYFPDTHTMLESIVMSSAPQIPQHHLEDDYND